MYGPVDRGDDDDDDDVERVSNASTTDGRLGRSDVTADAATRRRFVAISAKVTSIQLSG